MKEGRFGGLAPRYGLRERIKFLYKQGFKNLGYINLFIDFSKHAWKSGLEIFGCRFNY